MCQAYEAEQKYLFAREKSCRRMGYEAFKCGKPIEACPEPVLQDDDKMWRIGWRTAQKGMEPW